jgi:hypothetical protein
MDTVEVVKLIIGSGGVLGVVYLIYKVGGFAKEIQLGFSQINSKLDGIDKRLQRVEVIASNLDARVSHIEGYLMGRDVRNGTENR